MEQVNQLFFSLFVELSFLPPEKYLLMAVLPHYLNWVLVLTQIHGQRKYIPKCCSSGDTREEINEKVDAIIEFSGISDFINRPVKFYSSGMTVRLAFSIATSVSPEILVIDEALSVGDNEFSYKSFSRIEELRAKGATILFCSHSLYQVQSICNKELIEKGN